MDKWPVKECSSAGCLAFADHCAYIGFKFLVGLTKSGSTRSRSFLLPAPLWVSMSEIETASGDDRLIRETGIDARVAAIIRPVLDGIGFRLVRVRLLGQNGLTLQIMAERPDGTMTVEDCEEVSRAVSPALDVDDPIEKAYNLEVSSPGIDRPLVRKSDFETWSGHLAKIDTSVMVGGRKRFRGKIVGVDQHGVTIANERSGEADAVVTDVEIPFETLGDARLVLTDDLVADALRADKKARQEAKKNRRTAKKGGKAEQAEAETEAESED